MYLSCLSLTHFRNYPQLELTFRGTLALFQGENAQGKTNLLEAIYYLATSKPVHASTEREIVDWQADKEPIPYCRVIAEMKESEESQERPTHIEILLTQREESHNFKKQVKINGVNRRSIDLIGLMRAVLFLPEDIKLVSGSPGERRRYLDIALCQMDREYTCSFSRYQKVLAQRNSLLKTLREQGARAGDPAIENQLGFWDEQLTQEGSYVVTKRHNFVMQLELIAQQRHASLSDRRELLQLRYVPSFNPGSFSETQYVQLKEARTPTELPNVAFVSLTQEEVGRHFLAKLRHRRSRELAAGNTLYGPHRDDLRFLDDGRDLRIYGSRGQQRSAALSLKLAEVEAMTEATGEAPLLLLDDVMSELDAVRRSTLLQTLDGVEQALLTTTDWEDFSPEFRRQAQLFSVVGGAISPVEKGE